MDVFLNEFEAMCKTVMASIMRDTSLLGQFKFSKEDFPGTKMVYIYATVVEISRMEYQNIDKDIFLPALQRVLTAKNIKSDNLIREIKELFNDLWKMSWRKNLENFKGNYLLIKKFSLIWQLKRLNCDVSEYYSPSAPDEEQKKRLHKLMVTDINEISRNIVNPLNALVRQYDTASGIGERHIAQGIDKILAEFEEGTVYGLGYPSAFMNTALDGMQRGKYVVSSAGTNVGKTRTMLANVGYAGLPCFYHGGKWLKNPNGAGNGVLYIGTETTEAEAQTALLAFASGVEESKIRNPKKRTDEEAQRIHLARNMFCRFYQSKIFILRVPQPTMANLEEKIDYYTSKHGVTHVFFDYIQPNIELIREFVGTTKNMSYREDQALANLSKRLKEMAEKYNVFISTCTQVNGKLNDSSDRDKNENSVRGARAIIDKVDSALIMEVPTAEQIASLAKPFETPPNLVFTLYKNRGEHKNIKIWVAFDYKTLHVEDCFVTNLQNVERTDFDLTYLDRTAEGKLKVTNEKPEIELSSEEFHALLETEPTEEEITRMLVPC